MERTHTKIAILCAGLLAGGVLSLALSAGAEDTELDSDPRAFPYNGVLELDGESFSGQADFQFTLTDDEGCTFVEDHEQVDVFTGRFSVNLGTQTEGGVAACVFDANRVFLTIAVRAASSQEPHTQLSGRQRVHPVPFAYWAAEGSDLRIDGDANVEGGLYVGGSATVSGTSTVQTRFYVPSAHETHLDQDGQVTLGNVSDINLSLDADEIQARNNGAASRLTLNANGGRVVTGSDLDVRGSLFNEQGDLFLDDAVQLSGSLSNASEALQIDDDLTLTGTLSTPGTNPVRISDSLSVNNNVIIGGALVSQFGLLTLSHNVDIDGSQIRLGSNNHLVMSATNVNNQDRLNLIPDGGRVTVGGDLSTSGKLLAGDGLGDSSCQWRNASTYTSRTNDRSGGLGNNDNNDSYHTAVCNAGEYMAGWQCYATDRLDERCRAYCCRP